jgi:hypothetical protein
MFLLHLPAQHRQCYTANGSIELPIVEKIICELISSKISGDEQNLQR